MADLVNNIAASLQKAADEYIQAVRNQEGVFRAELDRTMREIEGHQKLVLDQLGAVREKTSQSSIVEILSMIEELRGDNGARVPTPAADQLGDLTAAAAQAAVPQPVPIDVDALVAKITTDVEGRLKATTARRAAARKTQPAARKKSAVKKGA